jgi:hypothetical protein
MAKYRIYEATFLANGAHLGVGASLATPKDIELPDDVDPSVKWDALDAAALKNLQIMIKALGVARSAHLDPLKDKDAIAKIMAATDKEFSKAVVRPPEEPSQPRDIDTNTGLMEQGRKVVGRASDKSPV